VLGLLFSPENQEGVCDEDGTVSSAALAVAVALMIGHFFTTAEIYRNIFCRDDEHLTRY
jgi:hypothetical protein